MISFWISVVPPKMDWMRLSRRSSRSCRRAADWCSRRSGRAPSGQREPRRSRGASSAAITREGIVSPRRSSPVRGAAPTTTPNQRPRMSHPSMRTSTRRAHRGTVATGPPDARCQRRRPGAVALRRAAARQSGSRPGSVRSPRQHEHVWHSMTTATARPDSSETNVCRRSRGAQSLPNPALSQTQTSWNIFRMCRAPSGVPVAVLNTPPVSCQCDPAASRSAAWSACYCLSSPAAICASFSARRDLGVFVSHPARSARSTATDEGSPSRSTSCSHPIARASSGRTPAIRLTTMQACISEAGRRGSFSPACRFSAGGACRRRTARPGGRRGSHQGRWAPFPRPGACTGGSRLWLPGLRLAFQKGHLAAKTWWAQVGSNHRPLACKTK
jgi:hypothetical protein